MTKVWALSFSPSTELVHLLCWLKGCTECTESKALDIQWASRNSLPAPEWAVVFCVTICRDIICFLSGASLSLWVQSLFECGRSSTVETARFSSSTKGALWTLTNSLPLSCVPIFLRFYGFSLDRPPANDSFGVPFGILAEILSLIYILLDFLYRIRSSVCKHANWPMICRLRENC